MTSRASIGSPRSSGQSDWESNKSINRRVVATIRDSYRTRKSLTGSLSCRLSVTVSNFSPRFDIFFFLQLQSFLVQDCPSPCCCSWAGGMSSPLLSNIQFFCVHSNLFLCLPGLICNAQQYFVRRSTMLRATSNNASCNVQQ